MAASMNLAITIYVREYPRPMTEVMAFDLNSSQYTELSIITPIITENIPVSDALVA